MNLKRACILLLCLLLLTTPVSYAEEFDFDEAVIYFLLTDRFYNGDETNDDPNGEGYDQDHPETYHGGDLRGLIEKLDYLDELGVNTIWITPIVDNIDHNVRHGKDYQYGYHGYWAKDFTQMDEHLGDLLTFKELIDEIHERDMKLMLDVVINHAGYGMKESDEEPLIPNYPTSEERAAFQGMLRLEPGFGDVTGELAGLPDFLTEDPEVLDQVIQWQADWIERARTDQGNSIDYFRVDTAKHVALDELKALKERLPEVEMIAEYFGGDIFFNGNVLSEGGMDSVLDFSFKETIKDYLRGNFESAERALKSRNEALSPKKSAGQFLSSHDEHGFLEMVLGGDEGLFKVAATLQLTAKGQPVIYYGEEIAQSGRAAGNMDEGEFSENRYDFDWSRAETSDMLDHYKRLLSVRNQYSDVFTKGERQAVFSDKEAGLSVFERVLGDKRVLVALNVTDEEKTLTLQVKETPLNLYGEESLVMGDGALELHVPAKSEGGTAMLELRSPLEGVQLSEEIFSETREVEPLREEPSDGVSIPSILLAVVLGFGVGYIISKKVKKK